MRIYLVRHPEPNVAAGICYGQTDLELARGIATSVAGLRGLLPADAALYSSPLRRCRDLANALYLMPVFDERLQEIHFGEWEMQPWDDIDRTALDAWASAPLDHAPPGGESVAALYERVAEVIRERSPAHPDSLVLITHAGVMKVCCGLLLELPQEEWLALRFDYGSVSLIEDGELVWHNRRND